MKEGYFSSLSNISKIDLCLGLSSKLFGHTCEKFFINGEMKIFVFGGFNGKEYLNKSFLLDCGRFYISYIIIY